jgi:hypothetical protein
LPAAVSHAQVGTAQLVLKLPNAVHGKNAQAIRAARGFRTSANSILRKPAAGVASAARRTPKYVDPIGCQNGSCGPNLIDIYVDGVLIPNMDGCAGNSGDSGTDSICVSETTDGTQSVSVPLYSTNANDIVVEEFDDCGNACGDLLAMGDAFVGTFTPGTAVNASVTMQENVAYVGILDIYNQADPEVMTGQTYLGLQGSCDGTSQEAQFGLYTADLLGDFVPVAGYGGTSTPTESAAPDAGGSTITPTVATIPGLWFVSWDNNCDGVTVTGTATNSAYAISYDVLGPYPQDINTNNDFPYYQFSNGSGNWDSYGGPFTTDLHGNTVATYGYANCAWDGTLCNGGPYQAVWNQVWYYYNNWQNAAYNLYDSIYPQVVTGTVDILDAPSPSPSP